MRRRVAPAARRHAGNGAARSCRDEGRPLARGPRDGIPHGHATTRCTHHTCASRMHAGRQGMPKQSWCGYLGHGPCTGRLRARPHSQRPYRPTPAAQCSLRAAEWPRQKTCTRKPPAPQCIACSRIWRREGDSNPRVVADTGSQGPRPTRLGDLCGNGAMRQR